MPASVEPAVSPSEFVAGSSEDRSGVSAEVSVELSSVPPIAEAISESGDRAEVVGSVPSAEDRASLKLVDPLPVVPVVAPSDVPSDVLEVAEDEARALGSASCCCIARIWSMRLVTASILINHCDRRRRRQLEPRPYRESLAPTENPSPLPRIPRPYRESLAPTESGS